MAKTTIDVKFPHASFTWGRKHTLTNNLSQLLKQGMTYNDLQ